MAAIPFATLLLVLLQILLLSLLSLLSLLFLLILLSLLLLVLLVLLLLLLLVVLLSLSTCINAQCKTGESLSAQKELSYIPFSPKFAFLCKMIKYDIRIFRSFSTVNQCIQKRAKRKYFCALYTKKLHFITDISMLLQARYMSKSNDRVLVEY